jgi:hypothetical protein
MKHERKRTANAQRTKGANNSLIRTYALIPLVGLRRRILYPAHPFSAHSRPMDMWRLDTWVVRKSVKRDNQ